VSRRVDAPATRCPDRSTGSPPVTAAPSPNSPLRVHRVSDVAKTLQTERKKKAAEAMEQAKLLYRFAQAQGKPYRPEAFFITAPEVKVSVHASTEVARELGRARLLNDAETYAYLGKFPKKAQT
jgi:hypothetical protein